jgi:hypothetical protein
MFLIFSFFPAILAEKETWQVVVSTHIGVCVTVCAYVLYCV